MPSNPVTDFPISNLFDLPSLKASLYQLMQQLVDAFGASEAIQAKYALLEPYLISALPLIGPAALAAACAKQAVYGHKAFRLAFVVEFCGMLLCLGENILRARDLMTQDIAFHLSQASCAADIGFVVLFAFRVEMPDVRVALAAVSGLGAAWVALVYSRFTELLATLPYSPRVDEAVSTFSSLAATSALIAWASQYGFARTAAISVFSIAVVAGNYSWAAQETTLLVVMRLSEVALALALAVGASAPVDSDGQGSKPPAPATAS